jgi:O-antigen/teichoic acid export membrane protein
MLSIKKPPQFLRASFGLTIASLLIGALGYLYQILMGRLMQPAEFALFSAIMAFYAVIGSPLGAINMILSRHVASLSATGQRENLKIFYFKAHKNLLTCAMALIVLMFLANGWLRDYLKADSFTQILILIALVGISPILTINTAFLQGLQVFWIISFSAIVGVIFKIAMSSTLIQFGFGVNGALISVLLSIVLIWLLGTFSLRINLKKIINSENIVSVREVSIKTIYPVILANVGFIAMTQSDIVFVNYFFEPDVAGIYAAASVFGKAVLYLPGGILMALFPMVSEKQAKSQSSFKLILEAIGITLIICGGAALIYFFLSQDIIRIAYGDQYSEAARILKWYGLAILPMTFVMIAEHFLIAKGRVLFCWIFALILPFEFFAMLHWHKDLLAVLSVMGLFGLLMASLGYGILAKEWLASQKVG